LPQPGRPGFPPQNFDEMVAASCALNVSRLLSRNVGLDPISSALATWKLAASSFLPSPSTHFWITSASMPFLPVQSFQSALRSLLRHARKSRNFSSVP
jgi:hypothetical protein